MPDVWLINGIPGVGKTTTARAGDAVSAWSLPPGRPVALQRDLTRNKSIRHQAEYGVSIAERWAHLGELMEPELAGLGLWLDSGAMGIDEAVESIWRTAAPHDLSLQATAELCVSLGRRGLAGRVCSEPILSGIRHGLS